MLHNIAAGGLVGAWGVQQGLLGVPLLARGRRADDGVPLHAVAVAPKFYSCTKLLT